MEIINFVLVEMDVLLPFSTNIKMEHALPLAPLLILSEIQLKEELAYCLVQVDNTCSIMEHVLESALTSISRERMVFVRSLVESNIYTKMDLAFQLVQMALSENMRVPTISVQTLVMLDNISMRMVLV